MYSNLKSYLNVVNHREIKIEEINYLKNIELAASNSSEGTTTHTFRMDYVTDSLETKIQATIYLKDKLTLEELLSEIETEGRKLPIWTRIIGDVKAKSHLFPHDFNELFHNDLQNETVFLHLLELTK